MTIVAVIQARMGSARLPGKVLADVAGRSMLDRVCRRAQGATSLDRIVVATSVGDDDRPIVDACGRLGVACFCGSPNDVLDRYHRAAETQRADVVVRITADCPLIDPNVIDRVVQTFVEQRPDYAANTLRRRWPRGLDTEVFSADVLARASREATEAHQRTHVTPYFYEHPDLFRLVSVDGPEDLGDWRWTVDEPADLRFVCAVYGHFQGSDDTFDWRDVWRLIRQDPSLAEINRHVRQKPLTEE